VVWSLPGKALAGARESGFNSHPPKEKRICSQRGFSKDARGLSKQKLEMPTCNGTPTKLGYDREAIGGTEPVAQHFHSLDPLA